MTLLSKLGEKLNFDKLRKQASQGQQAKALLENHAFQRAVAEVQEAVLVEWRGAVGEDQVTKREMCHARMYVLDDIQIRLATAYEVGQQARELLESQDASDT